MDYLHLELVNPMKVRVLPSRISDISIRVEDDVGRLVQFQDFVGPFVLCLLFEPRDSLALELRSKFFDIANQHYVCLSSDSSLGLYPQNKPYKFVGQLIKPILLQGGDWEIAVCDLRYKRPYAEV